MLVELAVRDLGVIEDLRLVLGAGMTAVTGETGAGKTLVVDAIELLVGGRADPTMVRSGADEAWVEGRFSVPGDDEDEVVLARAIPAEGRSRAYVNGRLATIATLAEWGDRLVDLHGQHAHQSLLSPAVQRAALDRFAGIDHGPLLAARAEVRQIDEQLAALGGDERARAREIDLLRFQVDELAAAEARLRAAAAEVADLAGEIRGAGEGITDDPARLDAVRTRRQLLHDLRRKYGESLDEVLAFAAEAGARLAELEQHDRRAAELDAARVTALSAVAAAADAVARARRSAAPTLAETVQGHLAALAMPRARVQVAVEGDGPADDVGILLAANPGSPPLPLAKVASGGELARTMLALRLVLTAGPPTLVFDEVDAGIGGEAAVAVGRSLAALGAAQQVLVVTHLPQVAAFADAHVRVTKETGEDHTVAHVDVLDPAGRVVELSRMLSGQPSSRTARDHAEELLATAAQQRGAS
jgi:DNA repair protein RecN (Recombination protein N)